ncbi:MAG: protein translocase subunit SecF [Gemmatimonadota bacterium]|nr:MAG: protein translocase subunit SecF [Gemmatimonadota bacterium]
MRIFARADYQFISRRRITYAISAVLIVIGLAAIAFNTLRGSGWLNYGIDFTGGVLIQARFHQPTTVEQVRQALRTTSATEIARFRESSEFIIRTPAEETEASETNAEAITAALRTAFGEGAFEVVRTELVGPRVGTELERKAALAIGLSFLLTLIYLAFRFETRFGVAAILATAHDILITVGFLAAFRIEVGVATVASILTVVGYSLNDTIVVFDRIRENLRKTRQAHGREAEVVNRSINETLPRTILTSGTTLAVLIPLLFLGGAVLRDFALILTIGIVFGTYSSIFVASPALLEIRRWSRRRRAEAVTVKAAVREPTRPMAKHGRTAA